MKDREEKSWERRSQVVNDKGVKSGQGHRKAKHISRLWGFKDRNSSHFDDALWGTLVLHLGPVISWWVTSGGFGALPPVHFLQLHEISNNRFPTNLQRPVSCQCQGLQKSARDAGYSGSCPGRNSATEIALGDWYQCIALSDRYK